MIRVAFHAINGIGLGHLVRTLAIASELPAIVPGVQRLVVTNARDVTLLQRAGIDYVQLPPRLAEPHADVKRVTTALAEPVEEAALDAIFTAYAPDLVVFDTHAPMRVVERLTARGVRSVLVQRELRPEALRSFLAKGLANAFDQIVVPHDASEVDAASYGDTPVALVGPIARPVERVAPSSTPLAVAMAGGGGQPMDAKKYLRAVVDAHLLARARIPDLETILVTGPYAEAPANVDGYPGLTLIASTPELPSLLAKASVVISQAGYNAIAEIRQLAKPAILIPGYRKAEDQRARAMRLVRVGAAVIAKPEARRLANAIEHVLLTPGAREAMAAGHRAFPLVANNRAAAERIVAPAVIATERVRRVALVAHDFAPKLGGMETVARSLAETLIQRGVDVTVYTSSLLGSDALPYARPLFRPLPRPLRIDLLPDLLTTIEMALRDRPDVIHLCNAGLGPWIPALRAALPCVVTANVHGNDLLAPWVNPGDLTDYAAAQVAGLSAADAVVCVSSFSRAQASNRGVDPRVLRVVENGIDPQRFSPGPRDAALAARLGLHEDDEVVLTVSRLAPRKGHRTMLRAIAQLARTRPRLRYVFTGAGELMRRELFELAAELGISSRIVATGFVTDDELPALYRLANVFALLAESPTPEDVEGFGVALLEAAATGLPTLATKSGGVPEAVADGVTGLLVEPNDPEAAAAAIDRLLGHLADGSGPVATTDASAKPESRFLEPMKPGPVPGFRERVADDAETQGPVPRFFEPARSAFGAAGRARVVEQFSSGRVTDHMLAIWNDVLARGPRTPTRPSYAADASSAARDANLRDLPFPVTNGVELVCLARQRTAARSADRRTRRELLRKQFARERIVRLRANGDGARLLPEALADCLALGHAPRIEVKLRQFLERDFLAHALPHAEGLELVHGVPYPGAQDLFAALARVPAEALAKVRLLRLFLTPEAREQPRLAADAVPEAHALRSWFAARGATVVPPPELMRYLAELPAGGPETGMIEPTNLCNLACPTCPTGTGKIKPLPQMKLGEFDRVLGQLAPKLRNLALWNYGEPLLNKELPAMIASAKKSGVGVVKVSSNVHFLDGERGLALLTSGLDVLILSVDGASQDTYQTFRKDGDFATVARAIAWLCSEKKRLGLTKPRIELQFIVMRHNEHELPEMRRLAEQWGVDKLRIKTVGADDDHTKSLIPTTRLLSRYEPDSVTPNVRHPFCTMAWDHTVVNVDGSVTPCCYLRPDMGDEFVMGNVFETPFRAIWRGEKYRRFRAQMLTDRSAMPVCNKCRGGTHDLIAAIEPVGGAG